MSRRLAGLALALAAAPASAQPFAGAGRIDTAVAEASAASALPERVIRAVIAQESGRNPNAVSAAGAMGLMQLMPSTWRDLQARLGLGPDPFDVRDNVVAGAAYLREMLDRFGPSGFLAAYNTGPARYAAAVAGRASLPRETRNIVAALAPQLGLLRAAKTPPARAPFTPRGGELFVPVGPEQP
jgi:soluble lytic murein transglycosylase-like protein